MKKLLFIATVFVGAVSFAQQEISSSQQELSKRTSARVQEFNAMVTSKVEQVYEVTTLDPKKRSELREIIATKEALLIRLDREGKDVENYKQRRDDIILGYEKQMRELLGDGQFNLIKNKK